MSPGEASFHLDKLTSPTPAAPAAQPPPKDPAAWGVPASDSTPRSRDVEPAQSPRVGSRGISCRQVPRLDAIEIVHLIAKRVGAPAPTEFGDGFAEEVAKFFDAHLADVQAIEYLEVLESRAEQGLSWIRPDRAGQVEIPPDD